MQAHQGELVERQNLLLDTWERFTSGDVPEEENAFREAWMQARATALRDAGFEPIFE